MNVLLMGAMLLNVLICALRAVNQNKQRGLSLPELMIGLATFSILIVGAISFVDNVVNKY